MSLRTTAVFICSLAGFAFFASACSTGSEPRDSGTIGEHDAGRVDAGTMGMADSGDIRPDSGGGNRDAGPPSEGLVCQTCDTNDDCSVGTVCAGLGAGAKVCLETCIVDLPQCPPRFDCVMSLLTPEAGFVCAPVGERCCVDADADDHGVGIGCRGLDCDDANPEANAGEDEICDGADNDCDGTSDEDNPGGGVRCVSECGEGSTVCTSGTITCEPINPITAEVCDGRDNDCDARVDEGPAGDGTAMTQDCYTGAGGTEDVGICRGGVQTCAGGSFGACVGQILPDSTDVCDGLDNDCRNGVDDGDPGGGFDCSVPGAGICATGHTHCVDGDVQCVSDVTPQTEICDDLDNDCDGTINDGYPGLGSACTTGQGTCRRGGVLICNTANRSGPPICDAPVVTGNSSETCDYADDDCDGMTDEGFRNGSGVYNTIAHCGACGFDCNAAWPGGAASYHVVPSCTVSGSTASCGFTCQAGYFDADRIPSNGCEFIPEPGTIYVSTPVNGGADGTACGTVEAPCATIGFGIGRAMATSRTRVRVSTGLYLENIALQNGISVLGGHAHTNWVRNPDVFGTTIRGLDVQASEGSAVDRIVIVAVGITAPTELSGFIIQGVNAGQAGNSIGVYIRDSDNDLLITDNDIAPAAGGNGADGVAGGPGGAGAPGSAGSGYVKRTCGSMNTTGPVGGANTCGGTATNGGRGGNATDPRTAPSPNNTRNGSGVAGMGTGGGMGGAGGYNLEGSRQGTSLRCSVYGTPVDGGDGVVGTAGADGMGGTGGTNPFGIIGTAGHWRANRGNPGDSGGNGGGGGGGGAPGGVEDLEFGGCLYPPTGGGGGAGGCGGSFGRAGAGGGGSFAIFIVHTTTVTTAQMPAITMNRLRRGLAGRGGDGGTGGGGGAPGAGGAGGLAPDPDTAGTFEFCILNGAAGGAGGRGGHAGGGGGGAGGASFDIFVSRPGAAAMPDYSSNVFEIGATVNTGGTGGNGGNASNTTIGIGGVGVAGAFGTVRFGT
jgi:hypothetical protein